MLLLIIPITLYVDNNPVNLPNDQGTMAQGHAQYLSFSQISSYLMLYLPFTKWYIGEGQAPLVKS